MKKIFTLTLGLFAGMYFTANAQTKNMHFTVMEEFTGENCPPCATYNPPFDALLASGTNPNNCIVIKYQCNIPSAGPVLYNQTQTIGVSARQTFYGVPFAPWCVRDGRYDTKNIASYVQADIDSGTIADSPFRFTGLTHTFRGPALDSVRIQGTLECTYDSTFTGAMKLHLVMIEKNLKFFKAPGTNGEKDFHNVFRANATPTGGRTIKSAWVSGNTFVIDTVVALPRKGSEPTDPFIYDKSQLRIVAFVQEANKQITQGGVTPTVTLPDDGGISNITGLPVTPTCATTISPVVTIKNYGSNSFTNGTVQYEIDGTVAGTYSWTGTLAPGATTTYSSGTPLTVAAGGHMFTARLKNPGGVPDKNDTYKGVYTVEGGNDFWQKAFTVLTTTVSPAGRDTIQESFEAGSIGGTAPLDKYFIVDRQDDAIGFALVSGATTNFTTGTKGIRMYYYNSPSGNVDEMFLPNLNLTNAKTPVTMTFKLAHKRYSTSTATQDTLKVLVSDNCGATWSTVYNKFGNSLATVTGTTTSNYIPATADYRLETINLDAYKGKASVMVKFYMGSAYGNTAYMDDLNIKYNKNPATTGVEDVVTVEAVEVYPNPANDVINLDILSASNQNVKVEVMTISGAVVKAVNMNDVETGLNKMTISTSDLSSGVYFVNITTNTGKVVKKVAVAH